MKRIWHFCACFVASSILMGASIAGAASMYQWSGTCLMFCSGTATGELSVTDTADITNLTSDDFLSWSYSSDHFSIAFTNADISDPSLLSLSGDLTMDTIGISVADTSLMYLFGTDGSSWASMDTLRGLTDIGGQSSISPVSQVPLPDGLPLFGAALMGLSIVALRRKPAPCKSKQVARR